MRIWQESEWQEKFRALHAQGLVDARVAEALGCTMRAVRQARRLLGLPSNQGRKGEVLGALRAEQRPGRCCVCDGLLPPRRRACCGAEECRREMFLAYYRDFNRRHPGRRGATEGRAS